jgi:hypothetical protein
MSVHHIVTATWDGSYVNDERTPHGNNSNFEGKFFIG